MPDDGAQPLVEMACKRHGAAQAAQVEVRVRVHKARQDGSVAEVEVGPARAVRFDGDDSAGGDGERAALEGRGADGQQPAGGQGEGVLHGWRSEICTTAVSV